MINLDLRKITNNEGGNNQKKYDQHGHNEDHSHKGGSNRRKIDLPGYKDDHKHYKKLKQSHGGFNQKMNQEDLKI